MSDLPDAETCTCGHPKSTHGPGPKIATPIFCQGSSTCTCVIFTAATKSTDLPDAVCPIEGCERPVESRGWCHAHYRRWRRHGDPLGGRATPRHFGSMLEAFEAYTVRSPDSCWQWTGPSRDGIYGSIHHDGETVMAHRWAYEHHVGPIPDGLTIDHLCNNTKCVNPQHLDPATSGDNTLRSPKAPAALNARKTHCVHGHEFTPENTLTWRNKRQCRTCKREQENERRRANGHSE